MKIRFTVLAIAAVFASALTLGVALPLQAQDTKTPPPPSAQPPPPPPSQPPEFSQSQLESFASAVLEVQAIRSKWQAQLQGAENAEKAQELQTQAGAEMVSAVEKKGLTVETYNAIATAARDNPALADQIGKLLEKGR
jgi:Domain of unknown function (DUF4168)